MLASRWATVVAAEQARLGLTTLTVAIDGREERAVSYDALVGPVAAGDEVLVNTTAVELGLGTGGAHIVIAVHGRARTEPPGGHAMKLRYSPVQLSVDAVEDEHGPAVDAAHLSGVPVVVLPLHSLLAPVVLGARATAGDLRIVYLMSDEAALAMPLSKAVAALRASGALDATITAGQAFGGDLEAVTMHSGLAAARAVAAADLIVVGMGPGNLGTASRLGFAALAAGEHVNAAATLGARPVVAPRISFADERARHRGLSHHTVTALCVAALARADVVLPPLSADERARLEPGLSQILQRHDIVEIDDLGPAEDALRASPVPLRSMGRSFDDDPAFFRAGAAAGVWAARLVLGQ